MGGIDEASVGGPTGRGLGRRWARTTRRCAGSPSGRWTRTGLVAWPRRTHWCASADWRSRWPPGCCRPVRSASIRCAFHGRWPASPTDRPDRLSSVPSAEAGACRPPAGWMFRAARTCRWDARSAAQALHVRGWRRRSSSASAAPSRVGSSVRGARVEYGSLPPRHRVSAGADTETGSTSPTSASASNPAPVPQACLKHRST